MECFLKDNLLELRETLWNNKFGVTPDGVSLFGSAYAVNAIDAGVGGGGGELVFICVHLCCLLVNFGEC